MRAKSDRSSLASITLPGYILDTLTYMYIYIEKNCGFPGFYSSIDFKICGSPDHV